MFRAPGEEFTVFKRVIGCPGDRVEMRDNHLRINDLALRYDPVDDRQFQSIARINELGEIVEKEAGNGPSHFMAYTPGGFYASFEPILVPEGQYYVLGDNRSNSEDSRMYGPISRALIQGRVIFNSSPGLK